MFDDNFKTIASLRSGIEPSLWKWLCENHREFHLNDNNENIDNVKTWTESELESSILFEVPKESNNDNVKPSVINEDSQQPAINKNANSSQAPQKEMETQSSRMNLNLTLAIPIITTR